MENTPQPSQYHLLPAEPSEFVHRRESRGQDEMLLELQPGNQAKCSQIYSKSSTNTLTGE